MCSRARAVGVRKAVSAIARRFRERHAAEHEGMQCLAEALWQAQAGERAPDDQAYLRALYARARLRESRRGPEVLGGDQGFQ